MKRILYNVLYEIFEKTRRDKRASASAIGATLTLGIKEFYFKDMKKPSKTEQLNRNLAVAKKDRKVPDVGTDAELAIDEAFIENRLKIAGAEMSSVYERLKKIKAEKRYKERTFDLYMKNRWGHSASWAYKLLKANLGVENFPQTSVENKRLKERLNQDQAAALGEAEPEKQEEILKEVAKSGKVTAKKIREKVKEKSQPKEAEFRVVVKDFNDEEVPEHISAEFQRAERESKEQLSHIQQVKNFLEHDDLITVELRGLRETAKDLLAGIKTRFTKHVLCPVCKGNKCSVCSKRGFVSSHFANKGIPKK